MIRDTRSFLVGLTVGAIGASVVIGAAQFLLFVLTLSHHVDQIMAFLTQVSR